MTKCERGDVALVWFPNSDQRTVKVRPALVVQADPLQTGIPQVIVAMLTSNLQRRGHPSRVFIAAESPQGKVAGIRMDSVMMADNIATIHEEAIAKVIRRLNPMSSVEDALRHTLAL